MDYKKDSNYVESSSSRSMGQKISVTMTANRQPDIIQNIADLNLIGYAVAQGQDEESMSSSSSSETSRMALCRRSNQLPSESMEQGKGTRRSAFFDDLAKIDLNTTFAHPGREKMWFGDLDFNVDISGEWMEHVQDESDKENNIMTSRK